MTSRIVLGILLAVTVGSATPQLSLLSGNRCSNCHVATSGGGLRNSLGWYSMYDVALVPRDWDWLSWLYPPDSTNDFTEKKFMYGWDLRLQGTRSFSDPNAPRVTFPMQAALYAAYQPVKAFTVEGSFNVASIRKAPNSDNFVKFPGQRMGWFSAMLQPDLDWPTIRAGFFRPSIGMQYDDHTMFPYNYVLPNGRTNIVAPNWAEWGGQITWEKELWLTIDAGVFGSEGLSQLVLSDGKENHSAIAGNSPTINGRVVFWPKLENGLWNGYAGTSILLNNDFYVSSLFLGVGFTDHVSLMLNATMMNKKDVLTSLTGMAEVLWQISAPIYVYARYETGTTDMQFVENNATVNSIVLGSQLFILPLVEFRPEYRILDTYLDGFASRWNFQLHIFY